MGTLSTKNLRRLEQFFELSVKTWPNHIALQCGAVTLTYQALECRVNQLAHYLINQGIREKQHVAILLERSLESYIAILAVLKTGAAYVPIEVEYPDERINYILADAPTHAVITSSSQRNRQNISFPNAIVLDEVHDIVSQLPDARPQVTITETEPLCYIIYTSGSSGKPKGVEVTHNSICHYVAVASTLYEMKPNDNVYQGFSLAFDASLEEFWMAFANGATLVACTSKEIRSGVGLVDFLTDNQITVFSSVPTLVSMLEEKNIPGLRLLILGGEACPSTLVKRFSRPGLRILNTYGPTEATVIATHYECHPDKPVTIGQPLPGYTLFILDENLKPVADGEPGELCVGGAGLARGYVNRPDMTASQFIKHPYKIDDRLYRTGDLAMVDADGNYLFLGRADHQVKIRGFRIELNEIESVLMMHNVITEAIVSVHEHEPNNPTLVAYLRIDKHGQLDLKQLKDFLRQKLPHYMSPTLFELVEAFPLLHSGKVDRKSLPKPKQVEPDADYNPPGTTLEKAIANVFSDVLQIKRISVTSDFFYDLGGHSLLAAKIISSLRQMDALKAISILDLYNHPTIQGLAEQFANDPSESISEKEKQKKYHVSTFGYTLCGIGQFFGCLFQYAIQAWQLLLVVFCYTWIVHEESVFSIKSLSILTGLILGMPIASLLFNVAAKWILIGRVKPGQYKLWGWFYFRWWLVNRLHHSVFPATNLIGTPLINFYYRLLGAKIGSNCFIGTASVASYDTLTLGKNTSIGYEVRLMGHEVADGWLNIGTITVGEHCFIGSRSLLGINTVMHDHAKLDNMTLLPPCSSVPANAFFSGSPARKTSIPPDHITILKQGFVDNTSPAKNIYYGFLHYVCLILTSVIHYIAYVPSLLFIAYIENKTHSLASVLFAAPLAAILFLSMYYACLYIFKKLVLNQHDLTKQSIKNGSYLRQWMLTKLIDTPEVSVLADSLYFPYLLRCLGSKLGKRVEMGETPHVLPALVTLQEEAFTASDVGLAWPNIYQGWIQFAPITIGKRAFVGNHSILPSGYCIGDEGLLGCMTTPPANHQAAEKHTAWLGSPAMFLPQREIFTGFSEEETRRPPKRLFLARLAIEFIRIILPTTFTLMGLYFILYILNELLVHYSLLTTFCALPFVECGVVLTLVATLVLLKWSVQGRLKPTVKPLWNIFIRKIDLIEYAWNGFINLHLTELILGTPFICILLRCMGARIGKKVYIGTPGFAEFDLISIGNNACINAETIIDTHLFEDRIFKLSTIDIHDDCNVGTGSLILYDTVMEKNSTLGSLSLLMKGEQLPTNTSWQGAPAQSMRSSSNATDFNILSEE